MRNSLVTGVTFNDLDPSGIWISRSLELPSSIAQKSC